MWDCIGKSSIVINGSYTEKLYFQDKGFETQYSLQ